MIFLNFNSKLIPVANITEIERIKIAVDVDDEGKASSFSYNIRCYFVRNNTMVTTSETFDTEQERELRWTELIYQFSDTRPRNPFCTHERCDHDFIFQVRSDGEFQVRCGKCSVVKSVIKDPSGHPKYKPSITIDGMGNKV